MESSGSTSRSGGRHPGRHPTLGGARRQKPLRLIEIALEVAFIVLGNVTGMCRCENPPELPGVVVAQNQASMLVQGSIRLPKVKSAFERVNLTSLMFLTGRSKELMREIEILAIPIKVPTLEASGWCPSADMGVIPAVRMEGEEMAESDHRLIAAYFPNSPGTQSPYIVTVQRPKDGTIRCAYTLSSRYKALTDQLLSEKYYHHEIQSAIAELSMPYMHCSEDSIFQGFYDKGEDVTQIKYSRSLSYTSSAWACSEACYNRHMLSKCGHKRCPIAATSSCAYWSYDYNSGACALNAINSAHGSRQLRKVKAGLDTRVKLSLTGSYDCQARLLHGDLTFPVEGRGNGSSFWVDVRSTCAFNPTLDTDIKEVLVACEGYSNALQTMLRPSAMELNSLTRKLRQPPNNGHNHGNRFKRSVTMTNVVTRASGLIRLPVVKGYVSSIIAALKSSSIFSGGGASAIAAAGPAILPVLAVAAVGVMTLLISTIAEIIVDQLEGAESLVIDGVGRGYYSTITGHGNIEPPDLKLIAEGKNGKYENRLALIVRINEHSRRVWELKESILNILAAREPLTASVAGVLRSKAYTYVKSYDETLQTLDIIYFYQDFSKARASRQALIIQLPNNLPMTHQVMEGSPLGKGNRTTVSWHCVEHLAASIKVGKLASGPSPTACAGREYGRNPLPRTKSFPFGTNTFVTRVLGRWEVAVTCPNSASFIGALGILILIHSDSCTIEVGGSKVFSPPSELTEDMTGNFEILEHKATPEGMDAYGAPAVYQDNASPDSYRDDGQSEDILFTVVVATPSVALLIILLALVGHRWLSKRNRKAADRRKGLSVISTIHTPKKARSRPPKNCRQKSASSIQLDA